MEGKTSILQPKVNGASGHTFSSSICCIFTSQLSDDSVDPDSAFKLFLCLKEQKL